MARLEARAAAAPQVRRASRTARNGSRRGAIRSAIKELHRGGVTVDRAPQEAIDLVIEANMPPEDDHPALRPRGRR